MKSLVLATGNLGKVKELESLLIGLDIKVLSLKDFPHLPEVVEDGKTFEENAFKKASEICLATNLLTLADDSGLEVDALDGAPSVYSARFSGEEKDDLANNKKLLRLLEGVSDEKRSARFRCAIAIVSPEGNRKIFEGTCEGFIGHYLQGEKGFGYDPLFYLPEYNKTFAELDLNIKNKISHRGKAFTKAIEYLKELLRR